MASSLAPTLTVASTRGGFHANSKHHFAAMLGAPSHQLPLQSSSAIASRGASSCHASGRIPLLLVAASGGSSPESVVEEENPSTSSSAEAGALRVVLVRLALCWFQEFAVVVVCARAALVRARVLFK